MIEIKRGQRIYLVLTDNGNVFGYFQRCTLEGKSEHNFGTNAHYIEYVGKETDADVQLLKRKLGQAKFIAMFSTNLKKWIFEKISELETPLLQSQP